MIPSLENPNHGLKTDLYELTMAAGYFQNQVQTQAVFELSCYTMPKNRSYLVACGLEQIVDYILNLRFSDEEIHFLKTHPVFKAVQPGFFDSLRDFRFTGDLWAMPEGEIFFAGEPIVQVQAPILEAQILETYLLSTINVESLVATKASRVVEAALSDGVQRGVIDFGSRRAHGPEAAVLAGRAAYIGGCLGTSNVYAGKKFGIPLYGTMAHSWVEAFDREEDAFSRYHAVFPEHTILLIDTYDTVEAVKKILKLDLKKKIKGLRLDSGDLEALSKEIRKILDREGLRGVKLIASGNLNEYKILDLIKRRAPIDLFGVGTDMVTSRDLPALNLTYKLVETKDQDAGVKFKAKQSFRKKTIPGRKQVFRQYTQQGMFAKDLIGLFHEDPPKNTEPLLKPIIQKGQLKNALPSLDRIREFTQGRLSRLSASFRNSSLRPHYPIELTRQLRKIKVGKEA